MHIFQCMLERTDTITNEVLEPFTFAVAYPTYPQDIEFIGKKLKFTFFLISSATIQTACHSLAQVRCGSSLWEICDGQRGTGINFLRIINVSGSLHHSNKVPYLLHIISTPTDAHKCIKIYYTRSVCFNHSCGHLQGGALQRTDI